MSCAVLSQEGDTSYGSFRKICGDQLCQPATQKREKQLTHHARVHASQTPHIERVVVFLEVDEQLGPFEVARGDADVVLGAWMVEFGETPVDESELAGQEGLSVRQAGAVARACEAKTRTCRFS